MYRFIPREGPGRENGDTLTWDSSAILEHILAMRGCTTAEQRDAFLHPDLSGFHDPFLLHDMKKAVERVRSAVQFKEKVAVYGDYDADGVTAAALLVLHLKSLGVECDYYIPDRHQEGYGVHEDAVRTLAKDHTLMITVDCGITSVAEVALARSLGMDTIVTDHHLPPDTLPDAPCVNAHLGGYPFEHLAGVGTAFKLVQALSGLEAAMEYADLAAVGTICDIVSLTGENRLLSVFGLEKINTDPRPGIRALLDVSGYPKGRNVDAEMISFGIGPKINAGGRIGHNAGCVNMLMETDFESALKTARLLVTQNQERQAQEMGILREAQAQVEEKFDFLNDRIIVAAGETWNPGVIGIVASRLVERYHFPVILLAKDGDGYTGSGRSVKGVHILDLVRGAEDLLIRCGGHEMACGLKIKEENIPLFTRRLQDALSAVPQETFIPSREYEMELTPDQVDMDLVNALSSLKPFGMGNPAPVFLLRNVKPVQVQKMGKNEEHLRMLIERTNGAVNAVSFRDASNYELYRSRVDILAVAEKNTWMDREEVQLRLCGSRLPAPSFAQVLEERKDALLRLFLSSCSLSESGAAAFRRDLPIRDHESGRQLFSRLLSQSIFGTLLVVGTGENARPYLALAQEENLPVDYTLSAVQDEAVPYNRIIPAGLLTGNLLKDYRNILLCDGSPDPNYADRLAKAAPHAVIYSVRFSKALQSEIAASVPDMETLRGCYRALQRDRERLSLCRDFDRFHRMVSENLPVSQAALHLSLCIFKDADLVTYRARPFQFALLRPPENKVDLTQTPTMAYLARFAKS